MIRSYETKFLTNQMSKDETKKKINHTKGSKIIRVKIKKKKWIRGQIKIFNWRVKLNWKIALTKRKKIKRIRVKVRIIKQQKLWLNDEIESQKNL